MKQLLVVAITLIASLSSYSQSSAYWDAYYNRKNDPQTWYKVSKMSDKEFESTYESKKRKKDTISVKSSNFNLVLNYGFKKTLGLEFSGGEKFTLGIGFNYFLGSGPVGEDYTSIFHWTKYANEVYEHKTVPHVGIYGITGIKLLSNLSFQTNLGIYTVQTYHNGYDRLRILGNSGYYYTTTSSGVGLLYGASLQYNPNKTGIYFGYDNFSGPKIGLTYSM